MVAGRLMDGGGKGEVGRKEVVWRGRSYRALSGLEWWGVGISSFKLINLFLVALGLLSRRGLSLAVASRACALQRGAWRASLRGFFYRAQSLGVWASVVAPVGSMVMAHRVYLPAACGIFLDQKSERVSPCVSRWTPSVCHHGSPACHFRVMANCRVPDGEGCSWL